MSLGTILISVAAFVFVAAYVARPFRRERVEVDGVIDGWVRQVRSATVSVDDASEPAGVDADVTAQREADPSGSHLPVGAGAGETGAVAVGAMDRDGPVNFCPYCGRHVEPDHVFCPKCGRQLAEGDPR
jgi:hypothetical protein